MYDSLIPSLRIAAMIRVIDSISLYDRLCAALLLDQVSVGSKSLVRNFKMTHSLHVTLSRTRTERSAVMLSCAPHTTLIKLSIHAIIFV
jgi:hypothetical protein